MALEMAKSPTDPTLSRLASRYGTRAGRTTGRATFHAGLDFSGKIGDPVRAILGGQVARVVRDSERARGFDGYGNAVVIYHPALGLYSFYAHLSTVGVVPGQMVGPGQLLGAVGNTTNGKFRGMGAHLHFEMRRPKEDGSMPFPAPYRRYNIDPLPVLEGQGIRVASTGSIREGVVV